LLLTYAPHFKAVDISQPKIDNIKAQEELIAFVNKSGDFVLEEGKDNAL